MRLHFHIGRNDPGYLPDGEVYTFDAVDDAIEAFLEDLDAWAEACTMYEPDESVRGQHHSDPQWTYGEEVAYVESVRNNLNINRRTVDLSLDVARNGLQVGLEGGASVLWLEPCAEDHDDD